MACNFVQEKPSISLRLALPFDRGTDTPEYVRDLFRDPMRSKTLLGPVMKMILRTGPIAVGLGLYFGLLSGCGGTNGSSEGEPDGTTGSEESTTSQVEGSSTSGNAESGSDGESSTSGESSDGSGGSGGSESGGETSSTDGQQEGSGGATDGESSSTEGEGGSGGATDGESASTDGEGGSGGATNEGCPEERPEVEAGCEANGRQCTYEGDCGSRTMVCQEGQWRNQVSDSEAAAPSCESFAEGGYPHDGDSCACAGELRCVYNDCEERGRITAVCNEGTWTVEESVCEAPRCGPGEGDNALHCEDGEVCVANQAGDEVSYACEENPCEAETSCECAAALCGDTECQIREEGLVVACVAGGGD